MTRIQQRNNDAYLAKVEAEIQAIKDQLGADPEIAECGMIIALSALQRTLDECPHCVAARHEMMQIILKEKRR